MNIKVAFINETSDNKKEHVILEEKLFENVKDRFDKEIIDYVYHKVVFELDPEYNFIDYDNCPYIAINYYDGDKQIYSDNCIEYMYNT